MRRILVEIQYKYLYYNFIRTNLVRVKSIVLLNNVRDNEIASNNEGNVPRELNSVFVDIFICK